MRQSAKKVPCGHDPFNRSFDFCDSATKCLASQAVRYRPFLKIGINIEGEGYEPLFVYKMKDGSVYYEQFIGTGFLIELVRPVKRGSRKTFVTAQ